MEVAAVPTHDPALGVLEELPIVPVPRQQVLLMASSRTAISKRCSPFLVGT
jgi:hypothetical protein